MKSIIIYSDGGSRGNPGASAVGAVVKIDEQVLTISRRIGEATNNIAEYQALLEALKEVKYFLKNKSKQRNLICYLDSELVVKQLKREYKIKNARLLELYFQVKNLTREFLEVKFCHIPREKNKEADSLVNQALDQCYSS